MTKNATLSLADTLTQDRGLIEFVDERVRSGLYGNASEVVWAGLRLLEAQEEQVESLRDALVAGEESGTPKPFDFEDFKALKRATSDQSRT